MSEFELRCYGDHMASPNGVDQTRADAAIAWFADAVGVDQNLLVLDVAERKGYRTIFRVHVCDFPGQSVHQLQENEALFVEVTANQGKDADSRPFSFAAAVAMTRVLLMPLGVGADSALVQAANRAALGLVYATRPEYRTSEVRAVLYD